MKYLVAVKLYGRSVRYELSRSEVSPVPDVGSSSGDLGEFAGVSHAAGGLGAAGPVAVGTSETG